MAQMYFAKFNINSDIFNVYIDNSLEQTILNQVLKSISDDQYCNETDVIGSKTIYKFCDIIKDFKSKTITGRLVKIYEGEQQTYDKKNDTVITINTKDCAASSTFLFDVQHEEIAFITRKELGYKQFITYFMMLVNKYICDYSFEMFLENNMGELKKKLYDMSRITSIDATIIPPNANEKEFEQLFGTTYKEFKESGATKYKQTFEVPQKKGTSINVKTGLFNRLLYGLSKGYGELTARGRNSQNEMLTVTSVEDAPYKVAFPDSEKDSLEDFNQRAIDAICKLIIYKQNYRLNDDLKANGEIKNEKEDETAKQ